MNVLLLKFGFEHGYGIMCAGDLPYAVCYVYVLCSGMMLHLIVVCTGWKLWWFVFVGVDSDHL